MSNETPTPADLLMCTTDIVCAYVANNSVSRQELAGFISETYSNLSATCGGAQAGQERPKPAVPVEKSVTDDHIICLEDGKKLKMLKRHLMASFGMTPEEYRKRWNLSPDYPMVAPNYAKRRSSLAKTIGLGRRPGRARKAKTTPQQTKEQTNQSEAA